MTLNANRPRIAEALLDLLAATLDEAAAADTEYEDDARDTRTAEEIAVADLLGCSVADLREDVASRREQS